MACCLGGSYGCAISITLRFSPWHGVQNSCRCFESPKFRQTHKYSPITCFRKSERKGRKRYPSELKKLAKNRPAALPEKAKKSGLWRFYSVCVPVDKDPGKDYFGVHDALTEAIASLLKFPVAAQLPKEAFTVRRKSFDARKFLKYPRFSYVVDMDVKEALRMQPRLQDFLLELDPKPGKLEHFSSSYTSADVINLIHNQNSTGMRSIVENIDPWSTEKAKNEDIGSNAKTINTLSDQLKVVVVGSGPAGLFASLVLSELGAEVTLVERGQPVEQRGRDIGALVVRRNLKTESNFCFGEGGAGTWSDGKLTTQIGKNSDNVQMVLKTLVHFGAPPSILIDGKPHLGTDKLVRILLNFRKHLQGIGVQIMFGTKMTKLLTSNSHTIGVEVTNADSILTSSSHKIWSDAVVLAVGHSARDVYENLLEQNIDLTPKSFAVGLRIEHPQEVINRIQYSQLADEVQKGKGKVPVADYKLATNINHDQFLQNLQESYNYSCYSFCMCPGGQVVLTSTDPSELCINGMSFSSRSSKWANAALVVTVTPNDFDLFRDHGPLAGVAFQRELEKEAAKMGGGNFVVPAQTVPDFLKNKLSGAPLPTSSYRMGVRASPLHELFPSHITDALQQSLIAFDKEIPGFISGDALLHAVETRTSSPVRISRDATTYECLSLQGLYPIGEGAGYAGGIVSAAVDGLCAGFAIADQLNLYKGCLTQKILDKSQRAEGIGWY